MNFDNQVRQSLEATGSGSLSRVREREPHSSPHRGLPIVVDDITSGLWNPLGAILALDDIVDPDDLVGIGATSVSYADLVEAGIVGFPLDLQNNDGVHYQVSGSVKTP